MSVLLQLKLVGVIKLRRHVLHQGGEWGQRKREGGEGFNSNGSFVCGHIEAKISLFM